MQVDPSIFKAYDIRGIVGVTLTEETARAVGRVLGSMALEAGVDTFAVGRDGRLSGPALARALMEGVADTGIRVVDVGAVPTPALYFAAHYLKCGTGVAVTGSHNPPEWNGLKMMVAGVTLSGADIQRVRERVEREEWTIAEKPGLIDECDVIPAYVEKAVAGVRGGVRHRIVVDAGNGIAGPTAMKMMERLPVDAVPLYCDVDGTFPNHHPDPSKPKNLEALIERVMSEGAAYGIAFDGDGDRIGVVTDTGAVIYPDRLLMLYAQDILRMHRGAQIVYDVKCSRRLVDWVREHGGIPVISATGHSLVKAKLRLTNAPLAGEMSGHVFFNDERWLGFDDGLYAAVRLIEILARTDDPSKVLMDLPSAVNTPELQIPMKEGEHHAFIKRFCEAAEFPDAEAVIRVDGLRVEWKDGFALARASNTTPVVVLRFEGDTPEALARVRTVFEAEMRRVEPNLAEPR